MGTASIRDDDVVSVGRRLPRLAAIEPREGRKLIVRFDDGRKKTVDLAVRYLREERHSA